MQLGEAKPASQEVPLPTTIVPLTPTKSCNLSTVASLPIIGLHKGHYFVDLQFQTSHLIVILSRCRSARLIWRRGAMILTRVKVTVRAKRRGSPVEAHLPSADRPSVPPRGLVEGPSPSKNLNTPDISVIAPRRCDTEVFP